MIVIIGGGLAGLSTAYHLGATEHVVLESESTPGGLCRSREIDGFIFDYTGHLLHLRDPRAIRLVEDLLPGGLAETVRKAVIRSRGVTLPFPYQANLHGLPPDFVARCIVEFVKTLDGEVPDDPATSFEDWALAVFGRGICDGFMFPYNEKLFRRRPADMTADWVSWAVPKPNLDEVVRGATGVPNTGMGYNATFRYPARGGIGVLPEALARRVEHLRCDCPVAAVDLEARKVTLASGERLAYDHLVVTAPLPSFLAMARGGDTDWPSQAPRLDASVVACLNLGVAREGMGDGAHWIYYPDDDVPFYRAGFPSNISDAVAPPGTSSMYVEMGLRKDEAYDPEQLASTMERGLLDAGLLLPEDKVLVRDLVRVDPGYVIFDRSRQQAMAELVPALKAHGVHLIGRYGAWTYSYMERAILDGLEIAESLHLAEE